MFIIKNGGATRDRTADPLLAKQVLSQLSYSPTRGAIVQEIIINEIFDVTFRRRNEN